MTSPGCHSVGGGRARRSPARAQSCSRTCERSTRVPSFLPLSSQLGLPCVSPCSPSRAGAKGWVARGAGSCGACGRALHPPSRSPQATPYQRPAPRSWPQGGRGAGTRGGQGPRVGIAACGWAGAAALAMPAVRLWGRRWHFATDIIAVPAGLSALFHAGWVVVLLVGAAATGAWPGVCGGAGGRHYVALFAGEALGGQARRRHALCPLANIVLPHTHTHAPAHCTGHQPPPPPPLPPTYGPPHPPLFHTHTRQACWPPLQQTWRSTSPSAPPPCAARRSSSPSAPRCPPCSMPAPPRWARRWGSCSTAPGWPPQGRSQTAGPWRCATTVGAGAGGTRVNGWVGGRVGGWVGGWQGGRVGGWRDCTPCGRMHAPPGSRAPDPPRCAPPPRPTPLRPPLGTPVTNFAQALVFSLWGFMVLAGLGVAITYNLYPRGWSHGRGGAWAGGARRGAGDIQACPPVGHAQAFPHTSPRPPRKPTHPPAPPLPLHTHLNRAPRPQLVGGALRVHRRAAVLPAPGELERARAYRMGGERARWVGLLPLSYPPTLMHTRHTPRTPPPPHTHTHTGAAPAQRPAPPPAQHRRADCWASVPHRPGCHGHHHSPYPHQRWVGGCGWVGGRAGGWVGEGSGGWGAWSDSNTSTNTRLPLPTPPMQPRRTGGAACGWRKRCCQSTRR